MRLLVLTLALLAACAVARDPHFDGGAEVAAPDTRVATDANNYACGCRVRIPDSCLTPGACGFPGSGTTPVAGYCETTQQLRVCFPADAAPPTRAALEADCNGRVRGVALEILRRVYSRCGDELAPCRIELACTALDTAGGVDVGRDARCDTPCAGEPLTCDVNGCNWPTANYVPAPALYGCPETFFVDTERVCRF